VSPLRRQNLVGRSQEKVHAPDTPDSDYYLCRPQGTKGQYGAPASWCRTDSGVTCKACLRKLNLVRLLTEPGLVTAYIGTGDPYALDDKAIVLATATRFTRREGADFTGWVVRNAHSSSDYSDPIARKADALRLLRAMAAKLAPVHLDSLKGE
jgi:hypothetical protein